MRGQPRDSFDLRGGIRLRVEGGRILVRRFLAVAKVYPARELAHDGEVDVAGDVWLERGELEQGGRGKGARAQVAEGGEGFAEFQEALFGADEAGAPFLEQGEERCELKLTVWRGKGGGPWVCLRRTGPPMAPSSTASAF